MRTTHFLTVYSSGSARCYGALVRKEGSLLSMLDRILDVAYDLKLLSHEQERTIWAQLWRNPGTGAAIDDALNTLEMFMDTYAAPGYAFQPWFTKDGTFWGWFPRTG